MSARSGCHTHSMTRARLILSLAAVLLVVALVAACNIGQATFSPLPVGACVNYRGLGTGDEDMTSVPCSRPHNHVVDAWIAPEAKPAEDGRAICPLESETQFWTPDGTYCLKLADGSSVTP
jgi:hypothetical protein